MSFCSPSYFLANNFFACVSLHISILPFLPVLPSILRTSQLFCSALPLPKSCWACPLQGPPPAYFLSYSSTLASLVLSFPPAFPYSILPFVPVLSMFVRHFPSQNLVEHARSRSILQRTSFTFPLPFPSIFPCIVNFTLIDLYIDVTSNVSVMCISSPFVLLGFSWKMHL